LPDSPTPREKQIQQAAKDAEMLEGLMDLLERGVWMPWVTTDQDGDPVAFATEELAARYVAFHHGGDQSFKAWPCPVRTEPEPDDE